MNKIEYFFVVIIKYIIITISIMTNSNHYDEDWGQFVNIETYKIFNWENKVNKNECCTKICNTNTIYSMIIGMLSYIGYNVE